jgi:RHS repeat-associated protein
VRSGAATGGPKERYAANLGHVQDDESGLIYVRARYYEPESGRFVCLDGARDGQNWYVFCNSDPINSVDIDGNAAFSTVATAGTAIGFFLYFTIIFFAASMTGHEITLPRMLFFAIKGAIGVMTAEFAVLYDKTFPVLNSVAKAFAKATGPEVTGVRRANMYQAFWIAYGIFLALLIDMIDIADDAFDSPSITQVLGK